ncbi:MAG: integrase core domain-containing protein [Nitrospinota bacterium]|nr:integrase core domain-containing protein [Nitrospinota bacterium]
MFCRKLWAQFPGSPNDNAFAEWFMKALKYQEAPLWENESFTDFVEGIPELIKSVYNRKRIHSGIGYLPPMKYSPYTFAASFRYCKP